LKCFHFVIPAFHSLPETVVIVFTTHPSTLLVSLESV
jgi:hypothetical protein